MHFLRTNFKIINKLIFEDADCNNCNETRSKNLSIISTSISIFQNMNGYMSAEKYEQFYTPDKIAANLPATSILMHVYGQCLVYILYYFSNFPKDLISLIKLKDLLIFSMMR